MDCPFQILACPNSSTKCGNSPISLRNFGRANWAAKQAQWHVPSTVQNTKVVSPSKLDEWAWWNLQTGYVKFDQWLGQVDPRRGVLLCLVRGDWKDAEKTLWKSITYLFWATQNGLYISIQPLDWIHVSREKLGVVVLNQDRVSNSESNGACSI